MSASASSSASSSRLFQPIKIGSKEIHRVAMAPLTRFRAEKDTQIPSELAPEYYSQRSAEGTFIMSEATFIAKEAAGYPSAPGIYSSAQIEQWKKITSGVHAKGGVIYCQLWALGRANQGDQDGVETVSASPIKLNGTEITPKEMTADDIARYVSLYKQAALNAIEAGFDGVEIHNANGYLLDQFLQSVSNKRTDSYGGASVENRARFPLEVAAAVSEAIGADKVGIRFSPWGTFQDMQESNPNETFSYITREVVNRFPTLAYVHFVEGVEWSTQGGGTFHTKNLTVRPSNDRFRAIVRGVDPESLPKDEDTTVFEDPNEEHKIAFLTASGYTAESALAHSKRTGDIVVFGRSFIANPDLPQRIKAGIPFTKYNRDTFYTPGPGGYTDYPFADGAKGVEVKA